eukprot:g1513.t1
MSSVGDIDISTIEKPDLQTFLSDSFRDVLPIKQNDGPSPPVAINYPPGWVPAHDMFRAVLKKEEYSERTFLLTEYLLENFNLANYTIWHFRRKCLESLLNNLDVNSTKDKEEIAIEKRKRLKRELDFLQEVCGGNPKNYQVWHHRRMIVEMLGDGSDELRYTECVFDEDAKNYHGWAHRQWAIKTFNMWDNEMKYVNKLIDEDVRNNSAWNQRWFVLKHTGVFNTTNASDNKPEVLAVIPLRKSDKSSGSVDNKTSPFALLEGEMKYAFEKLFLAPANESPTAYIAGLLQKLAYIATLPDASDSCKEFVGTFILKVIEICCKKLQIKASDGKSVETGGFLHSVVESLTGKSETNADAIAACQKSVALHALLAEAYELQLLRSAKKEKKSKDNESDDGKAKLAEAKVPCIAILRKLEIELDPIRHLYWQHRIKEIEAI